MPPDPERWRRIDELFQAAVDCAPDRRAEFLHGACGGDASLRAEVESLVDADQRGGFTESPAFDDGVRLLERSESLSGRRVGQYRVLEEIGRGGMGTVYSAVRADDAFQKRVAIKIIRRGLDTDDIVERFRAERQILATLEHPNITRLLDGGVTDDGRPYFVMELIEGEPIDQYCDRRSLTIAARLELFQDVCGAVRYAHQNLVIHRDIKPGNVLVTDGGVARLVDFGIAKWLVPGHAGADRTRTAAHPLTPAYASPEQLRGEPVTTATDVYSLGVLLYALLTGRRPHTAGGSGNEVDRTVREDEPVRASAAATSTRLRRQLEGDLDNIVLMAMRTDSKRRYASVEQLSDDLRRYARGLPVRAHSDTWTYRARKFVRRHRSAVAAAALIVASLITGVVTTTWQARIARSERVRADQRFDDIRKISTSFLFEFHNAIRDLPGSTPARQLLVQRALEYLARLSPDARNDRTLELDIAEAYLKVGDVQGNPYVPNLGDTKGAAESYTKALEASRAVVDANPGDLEAKRYVARSHRALADVLPQVGRPSEAIANFRSAIAILEAMRRGGGDDTELREELAASYQELGDLQGHNGLQNLGDPAGAVDSYRKSLALYEQLASEDHPSRAARRGVALVHIRIGDMAEIRDDLGGGLRAYRQALTMAERLSAEDPTNAEDRRRLALAHRKVGGIEEDLGQYKDALGEYGEAATINRALMDADPSNVQASMGYAISLRWAGDLQNKTGDVSGALVKYRAVLEILNRLAVRQPASVTVNERLAEMLIVAGRALAAHGDVGESRSLTARGLAMARELANRAEATPDDLSQYALGFLTCEPPALREPATALRLARASVEKSGGADSDNLDILAQAYFANHDLAHAIDAEQRAIALLAPIAPDQPAPPIRRRLEAQLARFKTSR